MNVLIRKSFSLVACLTLAALAAPHAAAQQVKVMADKPTFDNLPSPEFPVGKQRPFKPKDWLEMETKLKLTMSNPPKSGTCERLTIKWFVAVKNPERGNTMLLLTKDVEHVNIPLDEDIYCSVYLSPSSIKLLTGSDRAGKSSVESVGYEVLVNGVKVAEDTTKFRPGWWNAASDKISRTDSVPLLSKPETPFSAMWWDRYAEVATPAAR